MVNLGYIYISVLILVKSVFLKQIPKGTLIPLLRFSPLRMSLGAAFQLKLSWGRDMHQSTHHVLQQLADIQCLNLTEVGLG